MLYGEVYQIRPEMLLNGNSDEPGFYFARQARY